MLILNNRIKGIMDIQLFANCDFDQCIDVGIECGELATGNELTNAVILALFTDRRARDDDVLPNSQTDKRGWWGDALDGFYIGSRLWLLENANSTAEIPEIARGYAKEALAWLVTDGIADSIDIVAEYAPTCSGENCKDILGIQVSLCMPKNQRLNFKFQYAWQTLELQGCEVNGCELPKITYCASYPLIGGGYGYLVGDLLDPAASVLVQSCGLAPSFYIYANSSAAHNVPVLGADCEVLGYATNASNCALESEC
jgi:phage gp46-like protein